MTDNEAIESLKEILKSIDEIEQLASQQVDYETEKIRKCEEIKKLIQYKIDELK